MGVVILPPAFGFVPGVRQVNKHRLVQAFFTEASVETLDVGILGGLAGLDELYPRDACASTIEGASEPITCGRASAGERLPEPMPHSRACAAPYLQDRTGPCCQEQLSVVRVYARHGIDVDQGRTMDAQ